jgi:hypothetical protein
MRERHPKQQKAAQKIQLDPAPARLVQNPVSWAPRMESWGQIGRVTAYRLLISRHPSFDDFSTHIPTTNS